MPMLEQRLASALQAVDWNTNVKSFLGDTAAACLIAKSGMRLAVWAKQLETIEKGNPALCFVREMQVAAHHVAALAALGLYKPAAGAMRTVFESALYYTYFRTHRTELATLVRDPEYFVSKAELFDYHKLHTPGFRDHQAKLGLVSRANEWYVTVSAVIHGQLPGTWVDHRALAEIEYVKETLDFVAERFSEGEELVHHLFLCTVGLELWDFLSLSAKKTLISGLPGDVKSLLGLDAS